MSLTINENICFVENPRISYSTSLDDEATPLEEFSIANGVNTFVNNIGICTICPGINSITGNNDILNSSFYDYRSYTKNLYQKFISILTFDETLTFNNEDVIIIKDNNGGKISIVIDNTINTLAGETDQYGQVIFGTLNRSATTYARDLKILISNHLKIRDGKFYVKAENTRENSLILTQTKTDTFGSVHVSAPTNVFVADTFGKQGFENFNFEKDFKPFEENKSITKVFSNNPRHYKKTLGVDNLDYEESSYFDDTLTKYYLTSFHFKEPHEVDYPYTFNEKEINSLSTTINPIETISILEGTITTEQSILGIKGHLISSSIDARDRCNKIKNRVEVLQNANHVFENRDLKEIEPFSDEEYDDLSAVRRTKITVNYSYNDQIINNIKRRVLDTSTTASSPKSIITNKILYFSNDDLKVTPFHDVDRVKNNILSDEEIFAEADNFNYSNFGFQRDDYYNKKPNSIAYIGVIE
tara:strand:+ start:4690 stop:6105 length:1416 start_codon:yes stop_codon:yes gene_type:complete